MRTPLDEIEHFRAWAGSNTDYCLMLACEFIEKQCLSEEFAAFLAEAEAEETTEENER